jgi:hypothetical protein
MSTSANKQLMRDYIDHVTAHFEILKHFCRLHV